MAFSKGRSWEQGYIEDTIKVIRNMVYGIPKFVNNEIDLLDKENIKYARGCAGGDDEIELNIYEQLTELNPYIEWSSHFYESFVLTTYSFYEKTLKMLLFRHNITIPKKINGDYANRYYILLKKYIEKNYLKLANESCGYVSIINNKYKHLRNYLAHQGDIDKIRFIRKEVGIKVFYDGTIIFNDERFLVKFLGLVECILFDINEKLEIIYKHNKVNAYMQ